MTPVADHLWQSTLFAAAAALLAFGFRKHRAAVRYWLWVAASLKFLAPFSLLVSLGGLLGSRPEMEPIRPGWQSVIDQITPPLASIAAPAATVHASSPAIPPQVLWAVWGAGVLLTLGVFMVRWLRVRRAVRCARPLACEFGVPVLSSDTLLEPGVYGVFRPRLILPEGITERLTREQMAAILAHEMCHIRRNDNLFAALHMAAQSVFWFHPLVWWVGARLVQEREAACDEEVLRLGNKADVYAEGILNVCKFYLESPLMCASGVTGSDLRTRIEAIMQHTVLQPLTPARKALLAGVAACAIIAPVLIGITRVPSALAQSAAPAPTGAALSFDVASVKPANPEARGTRIMMTPGGGLTVSNAPVKGLIGMAYDVREFQISGGPSWITSERYDITAKTENGGAAPSPGPPDPARMKQMREDMQQRLRSLLADRFQLAAHKETKEMPAYVLTVAKNGPKLKAAADPSPGKGMIRMQRGQLNVQSANLDMLVRSLSNELGRPVIDQTGLTGLYDFDLKWVPEMASGPSGMGGPPEAAPAGDASGPSIFTALQEQLGLKLESHKAPAEIIVIDRIEKPSAN